jgi:hypothetical protein
MIFTLPLLQEEIRRALVKRIVEGDEEGSMPILADEIQA